MKGLFIIGIVCVFVLIAGSFYLHYDMARFKQDFRIVSELPQQSDTTSEHADGSDVKHVSDHSSDVSDHSSDTHAPTEEGKREVLESEKAETFTSQRVSDANIVFQGGPITTAPEASVSGLTPELEKIFIDYKPLYRSLENSAQAYGSLISEMISLKLRNEEIGKELSGTLGAQKSRALQKEYNENYEWLEEVTPNYNEVKSVLDNLMREEKEFFMERGFSSEVEFWQTHKATYRDWIDNQ